MTNDPNALQLANAAVDVLRQYWQWTGTAVAIGALREIGKNLYTQLKEKFEGKAAAAVLEEAAAEPENKSALEALAHQLKARIEKDPAFAEELREMLPPESMERFRQDMKVEGDNNIGVQASGSGNKIVIRG